MGVVFVDRKIVGIGVLVGVTIFVVGILIGYFSTSSGNGSTAYEHKQGIDPEFLEEALASVESEKLRDYLEFLTREPHIAELRRDQELVQWTQDSWEQAGLDRVEQIGYDVLLTWPNQTKPNKIYLLDGQNRVQFTSRHQEDELHDGDDHPEFVHAFNAYSATGEVTGKPVYVNYGRVKDFQDLETLNVSVKGRICVMRYGKIFRGNKVQHCEQRGGIGAILFSDPEEVAPFGTDPENVYPNTFFLPGSGIQRGSAFIGDGDPLSMGYPSVPNAYRIRVEDADLLPKILIQPIGYDDAKVILEKMGGKPPPEEWKGKIEGVDYRLGGEMLPAFADWNIKMNVNNYNDTVSSINVIGYLKGRVEPDRYVFVSNHRDAWGYGAMDPSSGTAQVMEMVRILGKLHQGGWSPRRTIVFCSWGSEEYGILGSYEWVMDKVSKIMARSVAVINVDVGVSGPIARHKSSPILRELVYEAVKQSSDPTMTDNEGTSSRSYYDFWKLWYNQDKTDPNQPDEEPEIGLIGSGSDHAAFAFFAGVPAVDIRYRDDPKKYKGVGTYPMYHTGFETFYLVDKIVDPGFKIYKTSTETMLSLTLSMSESQIIPYALERYPEAMQTTMKSFQDSNVSHLLEHNGASLTFLVQAIDEFETAVKDFVTRLRELDTSNELQTRQINDQMMQLERVFIMPRGLPGRPDARHAIFAPAKFNSYGGSAFPGISDLIHEIEKLQGKALAQRWEQIKRHVSDLMILVRNAADFLKPLDDI
ncbi:hypothetical protein TCAL_09217 [Tigriopus californicus]|uniref:Aminopeptidase NAALADL1 n=1 Tax=Tigriopus californicus TaxID=6832 RepID=A0A553PGC0_TIGCA|nr:N-acetylated-alpha-linked acidic dipeptidase 2-like [Tigriopus californicus]TRY76729.1 hypothetical protein TCAL_09217 [Tigriopus californicus]|eukprot:TCALIF_09217-PA protein Name:"Similar to Naalad2 N-acetylated-alpha-linked acidic dipeptidase 2 (Mus musculus)" AED:0.01 eAED:0.01 QI:0/-1/0/1/-1/1/1/0/756